MARDAQRLAAGGVDLGIFGLFAFGFLVVAVVPRVLRDACALPAAREESAGRGRRERGPGRESTAAAGAT